MDMNKGGGLPEGVEGAAWSVAKVKRIKTTVIASSIEYNLK